MFVIDDEKHAEPQAGEYATLAEAIAELNRRATLPWDKPPNVAPCTNWQECGKNYDVVEYDVTSMPWRELTRIRVLEVTAAGVKWFY